MRITAVLNDIRNKAINWVLVEKPRWAAKIIRKMTASSSSSSTTAKRSTGNGRSTGNKRLERSARPELVAGEQAGAAATVASAAASAPTPLVRDNGLRAANVAAGIPGAE